MQGFIYEYTKFHTPSYISYANFQKKFSIICVIDGKYVLSLTKAKEINSNMGKHIGKIIDLPKILDPRGNLTVTEQMENVPFHIRRVYWVYDVPSGEYRGGHAHKQCKEFIVAVSGSFSVTLTNGKETETYLLNHPYQGLLVDTNIWRTLEDFSSGAVCLVLASELFEEEDYIREYDDYLNYLACSKS